MQRTPVAVRQFGLGVGNFAWKAFVFSLSIDFVHCCFIMQNGLQVCDA
jgi:hypothetical protein